MTTQSLSTLRCGTPLVWGVVCMSLLMFGCQTAVPPSPPLDAPPFELSRADVRAEERYSAAAEREAGMRIERVRRALSEEKNAQVIPQLQEIIGRWPNSEAAKDARHLLGIAFYRIEGYKDAMSAFSDYLRVAPDGKYAKESTEYLDRIKTEYDAKFVTPEELDEQIAAAKAALVANPGSVENEWKLADLLWRRGYYPQAGEMYVQIAAQHPEYARDATFLSRVELLPGGQHIILSPGEIERREAEAKPILVINEANFTTGQDLYTFTDNYYVVSGQVVNRSDSILYGVQVDVTAYGVGNVVYDTRAVSIGQLRPKEIRAFTVRFSVFDDISNIYRHECVPTFQR